MDQREGQETLETPQASTEARVRGLNWLQVLSERPQVHCKVLAALFGDVPFENTGASNEEGIIGPIFG